MMHLNKISRIFSFRNSVHFCQGITNETLMKWDKIRTKYSDKQLMLAINFISQGNKSEMIKYGVSETYIKKIESLEIEKATFTSLEEFISQDLMSASEMEKVCSTIYQETESPKRTRKRTNVVAPPIITSDLEKLKTVVGLRIGTTHISWSQLELTGSNCNILSWDSTHLADIPLKANFVDTLTRGLTIASAIPDADAYVMEKDSSRTMTKMSSAIVKLLLRQQQYLSIIMTILSTRNNSEKTPEEFLNSLYTLKSLSSAQLFGLLLGHETISAGNLVEGFFLRGDTQLKNIKYVSIGGDAHNYYSSLDQYRQEELNRTLLTTLTFFEYAFDESTD